MRSLIALSLMVLACCFGCRQINQMLDDATPRIGPVTVRAKKGDVDACACDFTVLDANGKVYQYEGRSLPGRPEFVRSPNLLAREYTEGWIFFDVPRSVVTDGRVRLDPDPQGGTENLSGYWRL